MKEHLLMTHDDFEIVARHARTHHSSKSQAGPKTAWGLLAEGQTLGKSVNMIVRSPALDSQIPTNLPINMFQIQADDEHAHQLNVTLLPPQYMTSIPTGADANLQNINGPFLDVAADPISGGVGIGATFQSFFCTLEWGIGGVQARADVDIANGLSANLNASFVRATVGVDTQAFLGDALWRLSAFIGPGYPKAFNAQRTIWVGDVDNAATSNLFPIPPFAKSVRLSGANDNGDLYNGTIKFFRNRTANATFLRAGDFFFAGSTPGNIEIPNGASYFKVTSGIASPNRQCAIFQLSI